MITRVSRGAGAARRASLRGGVALVGAAILGGVLASPVSAATVPRPAPGFVPGASTLTSGNTIRIFYQQVNHNLITVRSPVRALRARHQPTLIAAARPQMTASSPRGTFSQAELAAETG